MLQAKRVKAFRNVINQKDARGLAIELILPELTRKMEEYRSDSMSAAVDIDQGLEKLTASIVLEGADVQLIGSLGVCLNEAPHIRSYVSAESEDCTVDSHEHIFVGRISKETRDPFKAGDASKVKYDISLHRYEHYVNGVEHVYIDPQESIERYMGVDRLAERRKALGMD